MKVIVKTTLNMSVSRFKTLVISMGLLSVCGQKKCVIGITFNHRRACSVGEPREERGNRNKVEESFVISSAALAAQMADEFMNGDFMNMEVTAWHVEE